MSHYRNMYRNIVFEGGGVLGIAYIGALRELHDRGVLDNLCGYAGSSVGSIAATMLACKADIEFMEEKLRKLDIRKFKDDSINPLIDGYNLIQHYGFCKGDVLRKWCGNTIKELTGKSSITFREIHEKYNSVLVITGTSLNKLTTVYFSHINYPDMPVKDAIRISASIPYFFRAIHFDSDVFVDGGVLNNYPLNIFDNDFYKTATHINPHHDKKLVDEFIRENGDSATNDTSATCSDNVTIGLKLVSSDEIYGTFPRVTNIKSFTINLIDALLAGASRSHVKSNDWKRTIKIFTDNISSVDFDLTDRQKNWLINQGKNAVIDFFADIAEQITQKNY